MSPRTVLITGASRGLGLEFVKQLLSMENAPKVLLAACREPAKADELHSLAKRNKCLKLVKLDVTNDADIEAAYDVVKRELADDGLNLLINNAGINDKSGGGFLAQQSRQMMKSHFDTNATSPVLLVQKFLPLLKKAAESDLSRPMSCERAAVVNMSSIMSSISASLKTQGNSYHYRSSKAALNMVTALMSVELRDAGILVTSLHPGWVKTDMGGPKADLTIEDSIRSCLSTILSLSEKSSGTCLDYKGDIIPW